MNSTSNSGGGYFTTAGEMPSDANGVILPHPHQQTIHFQPQTAAFMPHNNTTMFYSSPGGDFNSTQPISTLLPATDGKEYVTVTPSSIRLHPSSSSMMSSVNLTPLSNVIQPEGLLQPQGVQLSQLGLDPSATVVHISQDCGNPSSELYEYFVDQSGSSEMVDQQEMEDSEDEDEEPSSPKSDPQKSQEDRKAKMAEAARVRYAKLSPEEKKEINARRTQAQKRKRQRDKEIEELENLLRQSNDIQDDPVLNEQLREKRIKARRAEAARTRYQRMSSEERRVYNQKRRMRQMGLDERSQRDGLTPSHVRQQIEVQNAKKAEAARLRYHKMSSEEKREYNQRRTEAFRRRRMEEEILLSTPAGRISQESLQKAQQIMLRNAKRAEMARLRYQRMTAEQRKAYNQKRSSAKKQRERAQAMRQSDHSTTHMYTMMDPHAQVPSETMYCEEALTSLEKDVMKRTKQANMVLMRQKRDQDTMRQESHHQQHHHHMQPQQAPQQMVIFPAGETIQVPTINEHQIVEVKSEHHLPPGTIYIQAAPQHLQQIDGSTVDLQHLPPQTQIIIQQHDQSGLISTTSHPTYATVHQITIDPQDQRRMIITPSEAVMTPQQQPQPVYTSTAQHEILQQAPETQEVSMENAKVVDQQQEKVRLQRARRAERARRRYHDMTENDRKQFNAKRASALKKARQRDDELVQMYEQQGNALDEETLREVRAAQSRRAKRAASARQKYQKMTNAERRAYNAYRDAQRRQRRREQSQQQQQQQTLSTEGSIVDDESDQLGHHQPEKDDTVLQQDEESPEHVIIYNPYYTTDSMERSWDQP